MHRHRQPEEGKWYVCDVCDAVVTRHMARTLDHRLERDLYIPERERGGRRGSRANIKMNISEKGAFIPPKPPRIALTLKQEE